MLSHRILPLHFQLQYNELIKEKKGIFGDKPLQQTDDFEFNMGQEKRRLFTFAERGIILFQD